MPIIDVETRIAAPIERVFDLSRSVDVHLAAAESSNERAVGGVTTGLLQLDDTVTWEARHFGIRFLLTVRITAFERPHSFRDSMIEGIFRRFDHDHMFESIDDATRVTERFDYDSPGGVLGRLANVIAVHRHMRKFLEHRLETLKRVAESDEWATYLS